MSLNLLRDGPGSFAGGLAKGEGVRTVVNAEVNGLKGDGTGVGVAGARGRPPGRVTPEARLAAGSARGALEGSAPPQDYESPRHTSTARPWPVRRQADAWRWHPRPAAWPIRAEQRATEQGRMKSDTSANKSLDTPGGAGYSQAVLADRCRFSGNPRATRRWCARSSV
jgi:hypothetical protein